MGDFGKILIISPHMDDEVLGCGGIMAKYGNKVTVLYVTGYHPGVNSSVYHAENKNVVANAKCNALYVNREIHPQGLAYKGIEIQKQTNRLHVLPQSYLISEFEEAINAVKPDTVFVCFPSYNQDHRAVFDALITATRPHDKNWYVKNILVYEQPETIHTNRLVTEQFKPVLFTEIDINAKLKLYKLYKSQVRGHRGTETLKALAAVRGSFIGKPYAEAFDCVRLTV